MKTAIGLLCGALALMMVTTAAAGSRHKHDIPLPRANPLVAFAEVVPVKPVVVAQLPCDSKNFNCDPLDVGRKNSAPGATIVIPPSATATPVVVQAAPADDGIKGWLHEALLALLAAIGGAGVFKLPGSLFGGNKPTDGASAGTDDKKAQIEAIALQLLQSGVPSQVVATALGFIPGNAGFAAIEEKALNRIALMMLARGGAVAPVAGDTATPASDQLPAMVQDALKKVDFGALIKEALAQHKA